MEKWRLHKLFEIGEGEEKQQIGGAILQMKIGAVNGSLSTIDVIPLSQKEREESGSTAFVKMQVADRVVWMEPDEVEALVELLKLAHDASLKNVRESTT